MFLRLGKNINRFVISAVLIVSLGIVFISFSRLKLCFYITSSGFYFIFDCVSACECGHMNTGTWRPEG